MTDMTDETRELTEDEERTLLEKLAKVVYCDHSRCWWNVQLPALKHVKYHQSHVPLGKEDMYRGVCGRPEIGIKYKEILEGDRLHKVPTCMTVSDIRKTRVRFADLLRTDGTPFGGSIENQGLGHETAYL